MYKHLHTNDGSSTLISPQTGDTYHSMDGAISESLYVYIEQGLHSISSRTNKETINILEIGF